MTKVLKRPKQPDNTLGAAQFPGIENGDWGVRWSRPTHDAEQMLVIAGTHYGDSIRLNLVISDYLFFLIRGEGQDAVDLSAAGHNLVPKMGTLLVLPEIGTMAAADDR